VEGQKFRKYLLPIQLFGALMFAVVCIAYILGLPDHSVFHGELAVRVVIGVFGSIFFVGSIVMLVVAGMTRKRL
jgi:uncharacterized membrane protein